MFLTSEVSSLSIKIGAIRDKTLAEGPGLRFAIWTQGCSLKCKGCFNPHLWGSETGTTMCVDSLIERIQNSRNTNPELEGITLLGGEPFEQPYGISKLLTAVKSLGLSVMVFSGYRLEEILNPAHFLYEKRKLMLAEIDLLVDGRYDATQTDVVRPWVGSLNQKFHFLTNRYSPDTLFQNQSDKIEINVDPSGRVLVNGWAKSSQLETLLHSL